jgi:ATP-binding cassette subfamily B protein
MFSTARRTLEADGFRGMTLGLLLVILDESFAALDPETLQRCLRCVLKCAATVLVIAHP